MSTEITVSVGGNPLLDKARDQQNASRQAQLEKEAAQRLATQAGKERSKALTAQGKDANGNPLTGSLSKTPYIERRPAANRTLTGGVVGVQTGFPANYNPSTPRLLVGPPGVHLDESTGTTAPIDVLTLRPTPPGFGFPISGFGYASSTGTADEWYLLPLTGKTCLAIRIVTQVSAWYYFQVDDGFILLDSDSGSLWKAYAFVVSESATRQIAVPKTLEDYLKELIPPMSLNATTVYTGAPFTYGTGWTYNIATFNAATWRASRRYGDYSSVNDTLAKHFGMGYLTSNHRGAGAIATFATPAIYRFISGPMTIDNNSQNYAYMRQNYFSNAPSSYIGPCQLRNETIVSDGVSSYVDYSYPSCDSTKVGFDVTRAVPVDIFTGMDPANFVPKRAYDVKLNGASQTSGQYKLYYAWNWDNANYCRQEALSLGFSGADLTP
jgi:hypothetical protein